MRKPFIAGNWKMNMTQNELLDFLPRLADHLQTEMGSELSSVEIAVAPPYLILDTAKKLNGGFIEILAQNVSEHKSGAYTGEVSLSMLNEIGINASIVGHSERRQYFGDTDQTVAAKTKTLVEGGSLSVTCVGETLKEREAGLVEDVIRRQVSTVLKNLTKPSEKLILAYEPVWAIGTGKTASKEEAQKVHAFIRSLVSEHWGEAAAESIRIIYGGSVKPDNAKALLSQKDIDGALVGGASLNVEDFSLIVTAAQ